MYTQRELRSAIFLSEWLFELELPTKREWDKFQSWKCLIQLQVEFQNTLQIHVLVSMNAGD
jgi:hypothetical protein